MVMNNIFLLHIFISYNRVYYIIYFCQGQIMTFIDFFEGIGGGRLGL